MRDTLWKLGFATRLLFHEGNNAELPSFAESLLSYRPDVVIWFVATSKMKGTIARMLDRGIRVIIVTDSASDCRAHHYYIDREDAIKNALRSWRRNGIHFVTVLQNSHCGSVSSIVMVQKCLRDTAMPHAFANAESSELQDTVPALAERTNYAIILPSELAARFAARDPARFTKLFGAIAVTSDGRPDRCTRIASH